MTEAKTSEGERLIKLALFIKEHEPVDFTAIRRDLREYAFYEGDDPVEQRKHDQKVRRMFERDKNSLEKCGFNVVADAYNNYNLDVAASFAAPVDLTPAQASLLRLVCSSLLEDEAYPLKSELRMILAKIGDELELPDMLPGFQAGTRAKELPGFKKVRRALAGRKLLSFEYENAERHTTHREVEPLGCYFLNKHCYLVAWDKGCDGERVFRLDRMSRLSVNTAQPTTPDYDLRPFSVRDWVRLPFQIGDSTFDAEVLFDADNAWRATGLSMGHGTIEETENGAVWRVAAADPLALAKWCIEQGPGIWPAPLSPASPHYMTLLKAAIENNEEVAR